MFGWFWLAWLLLILFVLGCCIGSFLNVCIARLPAGKSLFWPPSHCGRCGTPIRASDNLPLLSYWLLAGRCRTCGDPFSMRYFWVELWTGLGFVLLGLFEIGLNIHRVTAFGEAPYWHLQAGFFPAGSLLFLLVRLLTFCLLLTAFCCNLTHQRVPASITLLALVLAFLAGGLFPWPWPNQPFQGQAPAGTSAQSLMPDVDQPGFGVAVVLGLPPRATMPADQPWSEAPAAPRSGLQLWPVWGPLPAWLPAGNWLLGLADVLAGALVGGGLIFMVRVAFFRGSFREAGRHGDVALGLLGGAFFGWQPILVAVLFATTAGLVIALLTGRPRRWLDGLLSCLLVPGLLLGWIGWPWIGPALYPLLFAPSGPGWAFAHLCLLALPLALIGKQPAPVSEGVPGPLPSM